MATYKSYGNLQAVEIVGLGEFPETLECFPAASPMIQEKTSSGDKDFANNVAVNQNNQNEVGTGFLRSNDKLVVQLDHALASHG